MVGATATRRCRAVLFTSLIDDPGEEGVPKALLDKIDTLAKPLDVLPDDTETEVRRKKLFAFIGELVKWENTTNETVIGTARELILAATDGNPPPVLDPFCGGGSIPLEAQRLGLTAYASDLNPVAVLITKALIEIPARFAGRAPVNPDDRAKMGAASAWNGAAGLAADVRYYGKWMRDRALERIGHLYPKGPNGETVIAWLWARTVRCPNPACGGQMPLVRSFTLGTTRGRDTWIQPIVDKAAKTVRFDLRTDGSSPIEGTTSRRGADCLICGSFTDWEYVRQQSRDVGLDVQMLAVVAEGNRSRVYFPPLSDHIETALEADRMPHWFPEGEIADNPGHTNVYRYGLTQWGDLFSSRQLLALTTFSDLVGEARTFVREHAAAAGMATADTGIDAGGSGADAYADAVSTYLAFGVDRGSDYWSSLATWAGNFIRGTFARQALAMVWDYAECNPFSDSSGNWLGAVEWIALALDGVPQIPTTSTTQQLDAAASVDGTPASAVATDPPYYDNIGYADLSDFFYVWLRRGLARTFPDLFSTLLTPKDQELVAAAHRFGGDPQKAEEHFESGLAKAFALVRESAPMTVPMTVYYAFRQQDGGGSTPVSTGWEKMLTGLVAARFQIVGTWPVRTERGGRMLDVAMNALASSVVLVCRPRTDNAPIATLREFQAALKAELPSALHHMIGGHIAPVDLAQAAIGPGMGVFSRYSRIIEPNGQNMTVRRALELINASIEEYFSEREGAFDAYTQFCSRWFEQHRTIDGPYGQAETLAMAKGISVDAIARDGLLRSGGGKVRLWPLTHYVDHLESYDPSTDPHVTAWESCHYLIGALRQGGVTQAGRLAHRLGGMAAQGVELSYRLYSICERNKWSEEALGYNALGDSWADIQAAMTAPQQGQMGLPPQQAGRT